MAEIAKAEIRVYPGGYLLDLPSRGQDGKYGPFRCELIVPDWAEAIGALSDVFAPRVTDKGYQQPMARKVR